MLTYKADCKFDTEAIFWRFWSKVETTGFCWNWVGGKSTGYGSFGLRYKGKSIAAKSHRLAYLMLVGDIPAGLELDHLCRNRACVNPDHLEPVSRYVNQQRSPITRTGRNSLALCYRGHALTVENSYIRTDTNTAKCRKCMYEIGHKQNIRKAMVRLNVSFEEAEKSVKRVGSYRHRDDRKYRH